jgi:hypothetical protein
MRCPILINKQQVYNHKYKNQEKSYIFNSTLGAGTTWLRPTYEVSPKSNENDFINKKKDERCRRTPGWNEVPFAIYYALNNRHNEIN